MGSIMEEFDKLRALMTEAGEDVEKADKGNQSAGTRLRKKMQEIKTQAQVVREKVMEMRKGDEPPVDAAATPPANPA